MVIPGLDGFGGPLFGRWTHVGVMAVGALAVLARALVSREERLGLDAHRRCAAGLDRG